MTGTIIFGYTSDHYGRFSTVFGTNVLMLISGLATPFCTDFISFTIIRFIMGLTFDSALIIYLLLGKVILQ